MWDEGDGVLLRRAAACQTLDAHRSVAQGPLGGRLAHPVCGHQFSTGSSISGIPKVPARSSRRSSKLPLN